MATIARYFTLVDPERHICLDGSFRYHSQRRLVADAIRRAGGRVNFVYVKAPQDVINARVLGRFRRGVHALKVTGARKIAAAYEVPRRPTFTVVNDTHSLQALSQRLQPYIHAVRGQRERSNVRFAAAEGAAASPAQGTGQMTSRLRG
jgi:hypothetical protein